MKTNGIENISSPLICTGKQTFDQFTDDGNQQTGNGIAQF